MSPISILRLRWEFSNQSAQVITQVVQFCLSGCRPSVQFNTECLPFFLREPACVKCIIQTGQPGEAVCRDIVLSVEHDPSKQLRQCQDRGCRFESAGMFYLLQCVASPLFAFSTPLEVERYQDNYQ